MQAADHIAKQFSRALDRLLQTANQETTVLTDLAATFNPEQCPNRPTNVRLLQSTQRLTTDLGELLVSFSRVFSDEQAMQLVLGQAQQPQNIAQLPAQLLTPYLVVIDLMNRSIHDRFVTSYLWNQTYELLVWYAYLGSSMSASSSLISRLKWFLALVQTIAPLTLEQYRELIQPMLKPAHIRGIAHIAERAHLLATATDEAIQVSAVRWWCNQIDSVTRGHDEPYTFQGLLRACPDVSDPVVHRVLIDLAGDQAVPEEAQHQAQQILNEQIRNE